MEVISGNDKVSYLVRSAQELKDIIHKYKLGGGGGGINEMGVF